LYGYLSQRELDMALEIQSLVKSKGLPLETGVRAFNLSVRDNIDLGAALESVGYSGSIISMSASRLALCCLTPGWSHKRSLKWLSEPAMRRDSRSERCLSRWCDATTSG